MKKLLFILYLSVPVMLFAQQDSTKHTFKIGGCKLALIVREQAYLVQSVIKLSDTLTGTKFKILGCSDSTKITSFSLSMGNNGVFVDVETQEDTFTNAIIDKIKQFVDGSSFIIKDVTYVTANNKVYHITGLTFKVKKSKNSFLLIPY